MTPLNNNDPYIDSTGKRSTLGAEIASGGGGGSYVLPTASSDTKGGVKVGSGLSMDGEVLSATPYSLPTASDEVKGGVKVGSGLTMDGEVLKLASTGMKVYYKDFNSVNWDASFTLAKFDNGSAADSGISCAKASGTLAANAISVTGYKVISAIAYDKYTGYHYSVSIDYLPNGQERIGIALGSHSIDTAALGVRVFYVKNEDIEAIT